MNNDGAKASIKDWVKQLTEEKMPVFAGTVTEVTNSVNSDSSSAPDVAKTILKDASLTSNLLKMVNSLYYNPGRYPITTVTRAVMVLGFDKIRVLALSLIVVDTLENDGDRNKMAEEMAQTFHAAVQAESLARLTKVKVPENVFVATLLSRLGNLAFWAFSGERGNQLQGLLEEGQLTVSQAEAKVLGFSLAELTKELSKSWSLGDLLENSFNERMKNEPEVKLIHLGQQIAESSKEGWNSEQAKQVISHAAKELNINLEDIKEYIHFNATQAKTVIKDYGITEASKHIPRPSTDIEDGEHSSVNDKDRIGSHNISEQAGSRQAQSSLQNELLTELDSVIAERGSISTIVQSLLDGILRGIDMDRALFTILSKDHKTLICKYALGKNSESLINTFKIDASHEQNTFNQVIRSLKGTLVSSKSNKLEGGIAKSTLDILGEPPYLIMPTIVKGKVIGAFIADRHVSRQNIEKKDFLVFQQFCEQASTGLTFLTKQH